MKRKFTFVFLDGIKTIREEVYLDILLPRVGDTISCNWTTHSNYYAYKVKSVHHSITQPDGIQEITVNLKMTKSYLDDWDEQ